MLGESQKPIPPHARSTEYVPRAKANSRNLIMKRRFALCALAGIFVFIAGCGQPAYVWQRVFTGDREASAEFPCTTTTETATDSSNGISIQRTTVKCTIPNRDITLHLSCNEIPAAGLRLTLDQRIAGMRSSFEQKGGKIISSNPEAIGSVQGCRMVVELEHGKARCTIRMAVKSKITYRAIASSASALHDDPVIAHFLESFSMQ